MSRAAATATAWFTTCRFVQPGKVGGHWTWLPSSTTHAKRMGTPLTACGLDTFTWHKLWEVPFDGRGRGGDVCRTCAIRAAFDADQPG